MTAFSSSIDEDEQIALSEILKKSAQYCERVHSASLYFVCREKIKEEIVQSLVGSAVISPGVTGRRSYRSMSYSPRKEKNVFIYDYQLIKKGTEIKESRTLLEENGEKKHEKDAPLKTKRFYSKRSAVGPVLFLSKEWQNKFNYKIVKENSIKGRKAYLIEAWPKPEIEEKPNYGKVWVDKENFSILKIEVKMESLPGFKELQEKSQKRRIKPFITAIHHYDVEKNGIRFPSRTVFIEEYTGRRMRRFQNSKTVITYNNYKFFTVDYEVTLEGELTSPFQRSLRSLPPLLGLGMNLRPATKGSYPLGSPRRSARSSTLEGELTSPFQRSLRSLPPLLGLGMNLRPATKGSYPLESPDDRFPATSRWSYHPIVKYQ